MNRLLLPYMNEAALLLCEGASIKEIEQAAKDVRHADGADHAVRRGGPRRGRARRPHDGRGVSRSRRAGADRASKLFERGRLGQKVGKGFFDYGPPKGGKPPRGTDSAEVAKLIDECRTGGATKVLAGRAHRPAVPADAPRSDARAGRQHRDATSATSTSA